MHLKAKASFFYIPNFIFQNFQVFAFQLTILWTTTHVMGVCMYGKWVAVVWWLLITSSYFNKLNHEWGGKANTSVGRFSKADPVLIPVLTMRIDQHFWMWGPDWKPTSGSHMTENRLWEVVQMYIYIYMENWTGSLIELRSGSQSSLYHLLVPLVLLLTWEYIYIYILLEIRSVLTKKVRTAQHWQIHEFDQFFGYFYWILNKKLL